MVVPVSQTTVAAVSGRLWARTLVNPAACSHSVAFPVVGTRVEPRGRGVFPGAEGEDESAAGAQRPRGLGDGGCGVAPEVHGAHGDDGVEAVPGYRQGGGVAVVQVHAPGGDGTGVAAGGRGDHCR